VERTSTTPSPTSSTDTSNVPPPRSKTRMVSLRILSRPYAREAAVGSFTILTTSSPAMRPASLVACRWASLKYAGTVITAFWTFADKYVLASSLSFRSTCADTSSGASFFPSTGQFSNTLLSCDSTLYATSFNSSFTSSGRRPTKRFTE